MTSIRLTKVVLYAGFSPVRQLQMGMVVDYGGRLSAGKTTGCIALSLSMLRTKLSCYPKYSRHDRFVLDKGVWSDYTGVHTFG